METTKPKQKRRRPTAPATKQRQPPKVKPAAAAPPTPTKPKRVKLTTTAAGQNGHAPHEPPSDFDDYFASVDVTSEMLLDYLRIAHRRLVEDGRGELWADQAVRYLLDQTIRALHYYQGVSDTAVIDLALGEANRDEGVSA